MSCSYILRVEKTPLFKNFVNNIEPAIAKIFESNAYSVFHKHIVAIVYRIKAVDDQYIC